jgi:hypothetical protein
MKHFFNISIIILSFFPFPSLGQEMQFLQDSIEVKADTHTGGVSGAELLADTIVGGPNEAVVADTLNTDNGAQTMPDSAVEANTDTIPPVALALEAWVDYGKLLMLISPTEMKFEGGINLLFKEKLALALEVGMANNTPNTYKNAEGYTVEGQYFRAGLDYVFPVKKPVDFMYIGVRYGMAQFSDRGIFEIGSEFWNNFRNEFDRTGLSATWGEALLGSEGMMFDNFFMGFRLRLRVMIEYTEQEPVDVYSIPGYGRTFDKSIPAFNLYVKYRIPF